MDLLLIVLGCDVGAIGVVAIHWRMVASIASWWKLRLTLKGAAIVLGLIGLFATTLLAKPDQGNKVGKCHCNQDRAGKIGHQTEQKSECKCTKEEFHEMVAAMMQGTTLAGRAKVSRAVLITDHCLMVDLFGLVYCFVLVQLFFVSYQWSQLYSGKRLEKRRAQT